MHRSGLAGLTFPISAGVFFESSRNATRHGLLSNTIVLEGESKQRFEELLAAEWQPRKHHGSRARRNHGFANAPKPTWPELMNTKPFAKLDAVSGANYP